MPLGTDGSAASLCSPSGDKRLPERLRHEVPVVVVVVVVVVSMVVVVVVVEVVVVVLAAAAQS